MIVNPVMFQEALVSYLLNGMHFMPAAQLFKDARVKADPADPGQGILVAFNGPKAGEQDSRG